MARAAASVTSSSSRDHSRSHVSMLCESSWRADSSSKNGAISSQLAWAKADGDGGSNDTVTMAPVPGSRATPDITIARRGSQAGRPEPVKFRTLLIMHSDVEDRCFMQRPARELETGGQSGFTDAVHQEQPRYAAEVGGSADVGATRVVRIDLVERCVERPGNRGERGCGNGVELPQQLIQRSCRQPANPKSPEIILGEYDLPLVPT